MSKNNNENTSKNNKTTEPKSPASPASGSSLKEHLTELRLRILKSALSLLIAFVFCWFFSGRILSFLRRPLEPFLKDGAGGLIFTAPVDNVMAHLQVAFFAGILLASPYWLIQFWRFISPGLYKQEKKIFIFFWIASAFLFLAGACFAFFVALPLVFSVLMNFGQGIDKPFITIKNYLSFISHFVLALGLVFEMPLLLIFLCRWGLISPSILKKYRRHALVILSAVSALITPPDILSLFLVLLPLLALYEISVWLSPVFVKKLSE